MRPSHGWMRLRRTETRGRFPRQQPRCRGHTLLSKGRPQRLTADVAWTPGGRPPHTHRRPPSDDARGASRPHDCDRWESGTVPVSVDYAHSGWDATIRRVVRNTRPLRWEVIRP